jgi:hypothetical protein
MSDDILVEFVTGPDSAADDEEVQQLTQALRAEILQLDDVNAVDQASAGPAPDGTRSGEMAAIGKLVVSAVPGAEAAVKVLQLIRVWLAGKPSTPTLKMTVGGNSIEIVADDDQQDALVQQFIRTLQAGAAAPQGTTPATEG